MIVTGPFEDTKKLQRDSTFMWAVTVYKPGVSSTTKHFPTREEAQAFRDKIDEREESAA